MAIDVGSAIAYLDLDTSGFTNGISGAASALKDLSPPLTVSPQSNKSWFFYECNGSVTE